MSSKNTAKLEFVEEVSGELPSAFTSDWHVMVYSVTDSELMVRETMDVACSPNLVRPCMILLRGTTGAMDQESWGVGRPREKQENRGVESVAKDSVGVGVVISGGSTTAGGGEGRERGGEKGPGFMTTP